MPEDNSDLDDVLRISRELKDVKSMDRVARGALIGLLVRSIARIRAADGVRTQIDELSPTEPYDP